MLDVRIFAMFEIRFGDVGGDNAMRGSGGLFPVLLYIRVEKGRCCEDEAGAVL